MALQLRLVDDTENDSPKYSIDSSVFLDIWKGSRGLYPKEVHKGLWSHICKLIDEGRIVAHNEVYKELKRHANPEFQLWLAANKSKFVVNTTASNHATKDIINGCYAKFKNGYVPSKRGGSAADPFVVGLAYAEGCVVFTQEHAIAEGNLLDAAEPAIPNVCKDYKIPCLGINEFLLNEGIELIAAQIAN